jgi:hypothetical protein
MRDLARFRAVLPASVMVAAASLFLLTESARSEVVEARRAYDFVDSLGVVTHVSRGKGVLTDEGWSALEQAIAEAGFRYVRTTITNGRGIERVRNAYETHGLRFDLRIDTRPLDGGDKKTTPLDPDRIDEMVSMTKEAGVEAVLSYAGPNEFNVQASAGNDTWHLELKEFMARLYDRVKVDPELVDKPVIAPSVYRRKTEDYLAMGDISDRTDRGCLHNYNGGRLPSYDLDERLNDARIMTPDSPVWVTEYGYRTAGQDPITEASQAKYLPRYAAEFFIRPDVERAFGYQIIDEKPIDERPDNAYGLLRNDFSRRPAFHAMKNIIRLLDDGDGDFTPGRLDYDLIGDLTDVHSFLVQKKSGEFYLVVWQEVDSYDRKAQVDLHPEPRPLTLTFNTPVAEASAFLPTGLDLADPDEARLPVDVYADPIAVALDVPDELMVIEIVPALDIQPAGGPEDTAAPDAPANLAARWGGSKSIALSWEVPDDDAGVVGFKVYKGGSEIATTGEPSYLFNGKWGRTYAFSVSALDAAGNESAPSQPVKVTLSRAWISSH